MTEKFGLMQACGLLPRDLAWIYREIELEQTAEAILDLLERNGVSPDEIAEAMDTLAKASLSGTPPRRTNFAETRALPAATERESSEESEAVERTFGRTPGRPTAASEEANG
jgi:hypothetical protein